jgi:uracil-DNA glycosylase
MTPLRKMLNHSVSLSGLGKVSPKGRPAFSTLRPPLLRDNYLKTKTKKPTTPTLGSAITAMITFKHLQKQIAVCTLCRKHLPDIPVQCPPGMLYPMPPHNLKVLFVGVAPPRKGDHFYSSPSDKLRAGLFSVLGNLGFPCSSVERFLQHGFFLTHTAKCSIARTWRVNSDVSSFCSAHFLGREIEVLKPRASLFFAAQSVLALPPNYVETGVIHPWCVWGMRPASRSPAGERTYSLPLSQSAAGTKSTRDRIWRRCCESYNLCFLLHCPTSHWPRTAGACFATWFLRRCLGGNITRPLLLT